MPEQIPEYDLSAWRKIGIERGYWAYFKREVAEEAKKEEREKNHKNIMDKVMACYIEAQTLRFSDKMPTPDIEIKKFGQLLLDKLTT